MGSELEIVKTADGSNTIYNPQVGENYHSRHGALQESRHVFVNSGLCYFLDNRKSLLQGPDNNKDRCKGVSILEVGFGTGLNFLLSADACTGRNLSLDYTGIEAYPLPGQLICQTGYDKYVSGGLWREFTGQYADALSHGVDFSGNNRLRIMPCKLLEFTSGKKYDLIYFDAFAAAYQPEMWDNTAISHIMDFLRPGGVFVTYAITGNLKRIIKALGCKVEKAPGAPGKREMLRAIKPL